VQGLGAAPDSTGVHRAHSRPPPLLSRLLSEERTSSVYPVLIPTPHQRSVSVFMKHGERFDGENLRST
jgi:hypothetical protein